MRRKPSAADDQSDTPTELIARFAADHSSTTTTIARHRRADVAVAEAVAPSRRSTTRRLAPLAVGAVVMLVATAIASFVSPQDDPSIAAPDLSNAIGQDPKTLDHLDDPTSQTSPPTTAPVTATPPPPPPKPPKPPKPSKPAEAPKPSKETTKAPAPAPPPPPPPQPSGDGKQAAVAQGWTQVDGDEFNGGRSSKWGDYNGPGHSGEGTRSSDAISVENGALVIRGDSKGKTGGMAWKDGQRFGKWEMRAKFPKGDEQYHPVLILWPTDVEWPRGGEVDFAETTSASEKVSFFLHYGASNSQKYAHKNLDITQWHNYAVEWVDGRITGFVDGEKWFESTDGSTLPPGEMHATIQLDYFPDGGSPQPSEMHVDYMRIYK